MISLKSWQGARREGSFGDMAAVLGDVCHSLFGVGAAPPSTPSMGGWLSDSLTEEEQAAQHPASPAPSHQVISSQTLSLFGLSIEDFQILLSSLSTVPSPQEKQESFYLTTFFLHSITITSQTKQKKGAREI